MELSAGQVYSVVFSRVAALPGGTCDPIGAAAADQRGQRGTQGSTYDYEFETGFLLHDAIPGGRAYNYGDPLSNPPDNNNNFTVPDLACRVVTISADVNALTVSPGGLVGIGTDTPQSRLDANGGILCHAVYERSSAAYKTDVRPVGDALALLGRLAPKRYSLIPAMGGAADIGLIAEEVEPVLPELVAHDADGKPIGIKYDRLAVIALAALQEQQRDLDSLRGEVRGLARRLAER